MKSRQFSRFARLSPPELTTFSRVSIALAMPALAFLLCEWLFELLSPSFEAPFLAAVAVTCWVCGPRLGLGATVLSAAALNYFFLPPLNSFAIRDANTATKMILFAAASLLFNLLVWWIQRTQSDLRYSEERYRSLAELIPFGAWMSDAQGNMQHLSDNFLASFHVTMQDCEGLGWLRLIDEPQREEVLADWQECMRNGYFWDYEYRMTARDGTSYVVLSRGVPLHDAGGEIRSWIGMHLNITERERLAEQRVLQARDIARFNAELEQFAYISAHDLQEPLRTITSYVQLLSRKYRGKLGDDADTYIGYVVEGASRLQTLLQDLMMLQRIGKNPEQRSVCELDRIAEKAWINLRDKAAKAGATLEAAKLPAVLCNEREMVELFENLFDNGIKYAAPDRPPVIQVGAARDRDAWTIAVTDNGIGIEAQYLKRIFDIFQRLHPRTLYPGTGIGLSICKKVVEVHGGSIWAESEEGRGATFRFTIPALPGEGLHSRSVDRAAARTAAAPQPDEDPSRTAR